MAWEKEGNCNKSEGRNFCSVERGCREHNTGEETYMVRKTLHNDTWHSMDSKEKHIRKADSAFAQHTKTALIHCTLMEMTTIW